MLAIINLYHRNHGHWDVADGTRRVFAIRGGAVDGDDKFWVRDERPGPIKSHGPFPTLDVAVIWCVSTLVTEAESEATHD